MAEKHPAVQTSALEDALPLVQLSQEFCDKSRGGPWRGWVQGRSEVTHWGAPFHLGSMVSVVTSVTAVTSAPEMQRGSVSHSRLGSGHL